MFLLLFGRFYAFRRDFSLCGRLCAHFSLIASKQTHIMLSRRFLRFMKTSGTNTAFPCRNATSRLRTNWHYAFSEVLCFSELLEKYYILSALFRGLFENVLQKQIKTIILDRFFRSRIFPHSRFASFRSPEPNRTENVVSKACYVISRMFFLFLPAFGTVRPLLMHCFIYCPRKMPFFFFYFPLSVCFLLFLQSESFAVVRAVFRRFETRARFSARTVFFLAAVLGLHLEKVRKQSYNLLYTEYQINCVLPFFLRDFAIYPESWRCLCLPTL